MNNLKNEENSNENLLHKLVTHGQDFLKDDQQINSMLPSNLFDELNDYRNSSHISENDLSYDEVTGDGNLYSLQKNLLEERSKSRDMLKQPFSEPIYNFNKKVDYMDEYQDLVDVNGRFNKIQISGGGGKDDLNSGSFTGTTSSNRRGSSSISRHKGSFQANEFVTKNTMFNTEENQINFDELESEMPHKSARYMENLEKDLSFNREREEFELIAPKRHILNNQSSLKSNFKSEKNYSNSTLNQVHANLQENSLNRSSESFHSFNNTYDSPNLNYKHVKSYGHSNKVESDKFLNSHIGQKNSYQNISSCSTGPYQSYETYYSPSQCNNTFISCPHMPHVIQSAPYKNYSIHHLVSDPHQMNQYPTQVEYVYQKQNSQSIPVNQNGLYPLKHYSNNHISSSRSFNDEIHAASPTYIPAYVIKTQPFLNNQPRNQNNERVQKLERYPSGSIIYTGTEGEIGYGNYAMSAPKKVVYQGQYVPMNEVMHQQNNPHFQKNVGQPPHHQGGKNKKKNHTDPRLKEIGKNPKVSQIQNQNKDQNQENVGKKKNTDEPSNIVQFLKGVNEELIDYVRTQKGSRNLQKFLTNITNENINFLFSRLNGRITELMVDVYGNYLCQKIVTCCSVEQRVYLFNCISKDFHLIAYHSSGTHALQSLIAAVSSISESEIIEKSVEGKVLSLALDNNGTHVIQKIITCFPEENRQYINKVVLENLTKLVNDINGISVVKKFVSGNKSNLIKEEILNTLKRDGITIVQNQYGNYMIQHVFKSWPEDCKGIFKIIENNAITLSMQKFSSNVVEKCLEMMDNVSRFNLIKEMFGSNKIYNLYKNTYGKFVLKKAFELLSSEQKAEIRDIIQKKINSNSKSNNSKFKDLLDLI